MVNSKALAHCVAVFNNLCFISRVLSIRKVHFKQANLGNGGLLNYKMAKFLKSIFHTTDRRKAPHYEPESEDDRSESPQNGTRRQLSISRSGRMRQANKKRHSLTLELYGDSIQIDAIEKTTTREYHVNTPSHTAPAVVESPVKTRLGTVDREDRYPKSMSTDISTFDIPLDNAVKPVAKEISPDEEIDNAFEILDKS